MRRKPEHILRDFRLRKSYEKFSGGCGKVFRNEARYSEGAIPRCLWNMREKYSGSEKPHCKAISFTFISRLPVAISRLHAWRMRKSIRYSCGVYPVASLDTVDNSQINVLTQRTMHRICTAATNEEVSFAYRVAIPRQRFRWRNAFSTRWRSL